MKPKKKKLIVQVGRVWREKGKAFAEVAYIPVRDGVFEIMNKTISVEVDYKRALPMLSYNFTSEQMKKFDRYVKRLFLQMVKNNEEYNHLKELL